MIMASTPSGRNVFLQKSDQSEQKLTKRLVIKSPSENKAGQDMQRLAIMESGELRIRFLYTYEGMLAVKEKVPGL